MCILFLTIPGPFNPASIRMSASQELPLQILSISVALCSAGSIATISLFSIPTLISQTVSRSLP